EIGASIESGSSFSEALAAHPKVFNGLYCNMARAGELAGVLETTLRRLAEFMEKAEQIKGKVKSAMFYPVAVLFIAAGIMVVLMAYVVPKFQSVFEGLLNGVEMPRFTMLIVSLSDFLRSHAMEAGIGVVGLGTLLTLGLKTRWGRRVFDGLKLRMPVVGPVFRKLAISRFSRTLGTLLNSGVPVLQALTIVRDTTGNVVVSDVVSRIHDRVKQGETISAPLRASRVFPAMVAGMVDVGEQTGALPDMLMKIADGYDDEVDNAVAAMTRLLEPILIVLLAVVVGSIVFAMFLPLLVVMEDGFGGHEMPD
ncbi:MAG TPA: type II secretion system F family protein, partial [Verrucomicrobiota bacterium]|nr:type II secretion system F family protein [Verrucomicrobiota bacterium]